jgi:hypothetical protein
MVVNVVSSLKLRDWPHSGRPHYNLPTYHWAVTNLHKPVDKVIEVQGSLPLEPLEPPLVMAALNPKSEVDRRLKDLEISLQAQSAENKTLHLGLAHMADRLKELNAEVNDILAFVTTHGYNPNK